MNRRDVKASSGDQGWKRDPDMLLDWPCSHSGSSYRAASQCGLPVPIGPGNLHGALGRPHAVPRACRLGRRSRRRSQLLMFWLRFTIAQSVGTFTAYVIGDRHDSHLFMHDVWPIRFSPS